MEKIEGICKEVLDKTEWLAIVTSGEQGAHVVATWGDYVRSIGIQDGHIIVIPAGMYHITESNLKKNGNVALLAASRQVQGKHGPGQGCSLSGRGELQTSGKFADLAKAKYPWARGALVIRVEKSEVQL